MNDLETVELLIDEENNFDGVFAISLVLDPAIESNFIHLTEERFQLRTINEEKRLVIGIALKANYKIPRVRGDHKFNIVFSEDTVRHASQIYMKKLRNNNTTVDHEHTVDGVSLVESWIVEDPERDKSAIYELGANTGDWVVSMKVENESAWQGIKEGKYRGFSIEGLFEERIANRYAQIFEKIKNIIDQV